jgi:hypothetical protein
MNLGSPPSSKTIRNYVAVARSAPSVVESYVTLVRAESVLAQSHLKLLLISTAVTAILLMAAISTIVCGSVITLRTGGLGLGIAVAVPVVVTLAIGAVASAWACRCVRQSTFVESRKRLSLLAETFYD